VTPGDPATSRLLLHPLAVKEGEHVARGQVLGQIDRRLQEAQVQQFRAGVSHRQ